MKIRHRGFDRFDWLLIVLVGISFFFVDLLPMHPQRLGDMDYTYHTGAKALSAAIRGSVPWTNLAITRAPAPVLYYSVPYLLVSPGSSDYTYWLAGLVWTIVWMTISILAIRRAGELVGGRLAGQLAAMIAVLSPFGVYYSYSIDAEAPAYVGVALFAYGWAKWQKSDQSSPLLGSAWLAWAGFTMLLLCRLNSLLLLPIAALAGGVLWWKGLRREAAFAGTCFAVSAAGVLIVFATLSLLPSRGISPQSSNLSDILLQGSFQFRTEPGDWRAWTKRTRVGSVDYQDWLKQRAELALLATESHTNPAKVERDWVLQDAAAHPLSRARAMLVRLAAAHIAIVNSVSPQAFKIGPIKGMGAFITFHALVNAFTILNMIGAIWFLIDKRGQLAQVWPLWGPWAALLAFHLMTYIEPRYIFPARPVMAIMAGVAFAAAIQSKVRLRAMSAAASRIAVAQ